MLTWALICIVAMLHSAKRTQTFPLYSGMSLAPPAELIQKLVAEEEGEQTDLEDRRHVRFQLGPNSDTWAKAKNSLQQENISNMVEDLKTAMLKLAPVDSLRNRGFFRQSPPKTTKRGVAHQKPGRIENLLDSSSPGPELETPGMRLDDERQNVFNLENLLTVINALKKHLLLEVLRDKLAETVLFL